MKEIEIWGESDSVYIKMSHNDKIINEISYGKLQSPYAGYLTIKSISSGCVNFHCVFDKSWGFSICPQESEFVGWKIWRSFKKNTENIRIEVPDDVSYFFNKEIKNGY